MLHCIVAHLDRGTGRRKDTWLKTTNFCSLKRTLTMCVRSDNRNWWSFRLWVGTTRASSCFALVNFHPRRCAARVAPHKGGNGSHRAPTFRRVCLHREDPASRVSKTVITKKVVYWAKNVVAENVRTMKVPVAKKCGQDKNRQKRCRTEVEKRSPTCAHPPKTRGHQRGYQNIATTRGYQRGYQHVPRDDGTTLAQEKSRTNVTNRFGDGLGSQCSGSIADKQNHVVRCASVLTAIPWLTDLIRTSWPLLCLKLCKGRVFKAKKITSDRPSLERRFEFYITAGPTMSAKNSSSQEGGLGHQQCPAPSFEIFLVGVLVHRNAPVIRSFEDHFRHRLAERF